MKDCVELYINRRTAVPHPPRGSSAEKLSVDNYAKLRHVDCAVNGEEQIHGLD